jgi:hypothetical protein
MKRLAAEGAGFNPCIYRGATMFALHDVKTPSVVTTPVASGFLWLHLYSTAQSIA